MRYALIDNGVVVNIIRLDESNAHDFPDAVKVDNMPVGIGDTYHGGKFYDNGVEVLACDIIAAETTISLDEMNEAYKEGVNAV